MIAHRDLTATGLWRLMRSGEVRFAGNERLKIYGLLTCVHGKRMKRENRVFFATGEDAIRNGYRPCGHCMKRRKHRVE